jgi:hypothetical protein
MAFKFGKTGRESRSGRIKAEIFDIRQVSGIRRNSDLQIRKLFTERELELAGR